MRLRFLTLILIFIFISCSSVKQKHEKTIDKTEVEKLISTLSWDSFEVTVNYGVGLKISEKNVLALRKMGKDVSPYLINVLKTKNKAVIAHIILTRIWEPEVDFLSFHYSENNESDNAELMINNLKWYQSSEGKKQIDDFDQDRIYKYWQKRTESLR